MFDSFRRSFLPVVPICHVQTVSELGRSLESLPGESTEIGAAMLYCAALYAGSICSADGHANSFGLATSLGQVFDDLVCSLNLSEFFLISPTLNAVQGYVVFNTARAARLAPFSAFAFLPLAIRSAQTLGFHKDHLHINSFQQQERKAIWCHLAFLDFESTIASGLDGLIGPTEWPIDTPLPFRSDAGEPLQPMDFSMHGHWMFVQSILTWKEVYPQYGDLVEYQRKVRELREQIRDAERDNCGAGSSYTWTSKWTEPSVWLGCSIGELLFLHIQGARARSLPPRGAFSRHTSAYPPRPKPQGFYGLSRAYCSPFTRLSFFSSI